MYITFFLKILLTSSGDLVINITDFSMFIPIRVFMEWFFKRTSKKYKNSK